MWAHISIKSRTMSLTSPACGALAPAVEHHSEQRLRLQVRTRPLPAERVQLIGLPGGLPVARRE